MPSRWRRISHVTRRVFSRNRFAACAWPEIHCANNEARDLPGAARRKLKSGASCRATVGISVFYRFPCARMFWIWRCEHLGSNLQVWLTARPSHHEEGASAGLPGKLLNCPVGAFAVEFLRTHSTGTTTWFNMVLPSSISSTIRRTAMAPNSSLKTRMVDKHGSTCMQTSMSSKPMTETCPGTRRFFMCRYRTAPTATDALALHDW